MEIILNEIIPDIPKQEVIDPNDGFTNQVSFNFNQILSLTKTDLKPTSSRSELIFAQ